MKILIELPSWLGDTVMSTPSIDNLISHYQDVEITLIGSLVSIEVLRNHPKVVKTFVISKRYRFLMNFAKQLGRFDIFFSFRGSFRSKLLKLCISSNNKFQFDHNLYKNLHQVEKYNNFINDCLNTNLSPGYLNVNLSLSVKDIGSVSFLGINPGASYGESKQW